MVSKLQMEAGLCEEQLNQADALLQSVREGHMHRQEGTGPSSSPWVPPALSLCSGHH